MPLYAYRCRDCGIEFERLQSFSDTSVPTCPEGHDNVVRLLKPPAIHFKGTGWYVTDSKRGNGVNGSSKPSSSSTSKKPEEKKKETSASSSD